MYVIVEVLFDQPPVKKDFKQVTKAVKSLAIDKDDIDVYQPAEEQEKLIAEFFMNKGRQIDLADGINTEFSNTVENIADISVSFPKIKNEKPAPTPSAESKPFTAKQGQYLAFIYYYTRIHGIPPAEAEIQKYFKVTPPTSHQMILRLEQLGLIHRVPNTSRSIKVLLPREALPDLE